MCAAGGDGGIWVNGGKNNVIENNMIVDCKRLMTTYSPHFYAPQIAGFLTGNRVCRNIYYHSQSGGAWFALNDWTDRAIGESDWNLFSDADGKPIAVDGRAILFTEWQEMGYDEHSVIADPMFLDPEHDDYRLTAESPAFRLGFVPVDVTRIGIRRQERTDQARPRSDDDSPQS